ncbi:MAG: proprotein convertase P-domain-containing protein [Nannocystales bacterium]
MRATARVRSIRSHRGALLVGAALCFGPGCGDDGTAGSGSADASTSGSPDDTSSTGGPTSGTGTTSTESSSTGTSAPTSSSSTTGDTTGDTTGSGTSDTDGDPTSSTGDTTGSSAVDVPFTVLDPSILELTARVPPGWVVITSAAQWASFTDAPVPAGVTFPTQWVMFGSRGPQPYPGHALTVDALSWQGDTLSVSGDQVDPADDCETYEFIWPADTLVFFDALDSEVADVDDQTAVLESSCAAGATASMDCDLDSPCATGLLCAGIIRSTVLLDDPGGLCLDSSNSGVFTGGSVAIPAAGATAELSMQVSGLTTVDMDVTILLDLDHPAPQELVIELRNPDGNQVSVADLQSTELHPGGVPIVPTGFSSDESVNGTWTLVVRDTIDNDNSGSVQSWDLEIMSRFD